MPNRTSSPSTGKKSVQPDKPNPTFPLFAHANGQVAKKIRGRFHYFGVWEGAEAALELFKREWPYLSQGRTPPSRMDRDGIDIDSLCEEFLQFKERKLKLGELTERTFSRYYRSCKQMSAFWGKTRLTIERNQLQASFDIVSEQLKTLQNAARRVVELS